MFENSRSSFRPSEEESRSFDSSFAKDSSAASFTPVESAEKSSFSSPSSYEKSNLSSVPHTEVTKTDVSCIATPTIDENGNQVIETVTKTNREVNGNKLPTEIVTNKIPLTEIQQLQAEQQPQLESSRAVESETRQRRKQPAVSASAATQDSLQNAKEWVDANAPKAKEFLMEGANKTHEWVETNAPKAKEWVEANAPKAKEWVETNAPKAREWVESNATEAKEWVETNAPKAKEWMNHQLEDVSAAAKQVDTTQIKLYASRYWPKVQQIAPLLASLLLALVLGSYLYRNANHLGLHNNPNNEAVVPISPVMNHPVHMESTAAPLPHTTVSHDYYQNQHVPHRVSELQEKASELSESASSTLHQAASSVRDAASNAASSAASTAKNVADTMNEKLAEAKQSAEDLTDRMSHQAKHLHHHGKRQGEHLVREAKHRSNNLAYHANEKVEDLKDSAWDMKEDAKLKLNQMHHQAQHATHQVKQQVDAGIDSAKQQLNQLKSSVSSATTSPSSSHSHTHTHTHPAPSSTVHQHVEVDQFQVESGADSELMGQTPAAGPYDEVATPPHQHTYPHTVKGAAEYVKDKIGEGLHSLGKKSVQQPEPLR